MSFSRSAAFLLGPALLASCGDSPTEAPREVRCGGGEIRLAVGEAVELADGAQPCAFAAAAGAEYALAWFDGSAVEAARQPPGEAREYPGTYSVTVEALADGAAAALSPRLDVRMGDGGTLPAADFSVSGEAPASLAPVERGRPWALGDTFSVAVPCPCTGPATRAARVLRVYDGYLVVAAVNGTGAAAVERYLEVLDQAVPVVFQHGVPVLRATLDGAMPVTSEASRQLLVLLEPSLGQYGGYTHTFVADGRVYSFFRLATAGQWDLPRTVFLVTHELAHAFQREYMHATRASSTDESSLGSALWSVEGGADLLAWEAARRAAGVPLAANAEWRSPGASPYGEVMATLAQPGHGELARGYGAARGFLRDLVVRRAAAGEPVETALREVARGALEGWYGYDGMAVRRRGLTARMQALMRGWEPESAVLTWTLSHAGDDRTGSPVFQDRVSLRVWDAPADRVYAWRPAATLSGPGSATVERAIGSPGFVYARDPGTGLQLRLSAAPQVRWMILRIG